MKKSLVVLLIAVLVAGSAFATVTGTASLSFGYDFEDKDFALDNAKAGVATFTFDVDSETGATAASEKAVYAKFSGAYSLSLSNTVLADALTLDEAYVMGEGWKVDFTSVAHGLKVEAFGATFKGWYEKKGDWGIDVATPKFEIVDGLTISATASYVQAKNDKDNIANYSLTGDAADALDDALDVWTATYEDGTFKNEYLVTLENAKAEAKNTKKVTEADFLKDPTNLNSKRYAKACELYDETVAALATAQTMDGMKAAYGEAICKDGDISYKNGMLKEGKADKDTATFNLNNITKDEDYAKDLAEVIAVVGLYFEEKESWGLDKYAKGDIAKTKATYTLQNTDKAAFDFDGKATIKAGVALDYAKDSALAGVNGNIEINGLTKKVAKWSVGGKVGYDFFEANVGIDNDKVLAAGLKLDLSSFLGYAFDFEIAGTDLLEKDSDGEIDRTLTVGIDTTLASLKVGFDGEVNFTDKAVEFGIDTACGGVTFGMTWGTEWGQSFEKITDKAWTMGFKAGYTCDILTAKTTVDLTNIGNNSDKAHNYTDTIVEVKLGASVESKALIDGATVSLTYADAVYNGPDADKGAITAAIKVAF